MALADIYQKATLVQIPSGYKAADDKLYSVVPSDGTGDFTVDSDADATRVNKDGLIESVVADQARLDYNPSNPQDPTLLLEPSRTNNILQSNDPSGANWTDPLSRWSLLTDTTTAPDGGIVRIIELTESGGSLIRLTGFSIAAGTYTVSFYMKDIDGNLTGGNVDIGDEGSAAPSPTFNNIGNNFVRASITITITGTKTFLDLQPTFSGSTNKVAIWGCQLEAGSYATSLIPTSASAVTRTIDSCNKTTFTNIPSNYPFTAFWQGKIDDYDASGFTSQVPFSLAATGTFNCYFAINFKSTSQLTLRRRNDSDNSQVISFTSNKDTTYKLAVCFISATAAKVYINGTKVLDSTSLTSVPYIGADTPDSVFIGQLRDNTDTGKRNSCNQFMLFNEELSESELTTLTS